MECTQRLECTQELYETRTERVCPEQIGFLGICGVKHPVKKGPNKIGRDPQTCNIVLNLNSVSRQHAVINVLNQKNFMLMDLDSANKTKLMDKTLPPYIPHPLKNGDMVQFGDIFGVFRLLEEDDDLPMTQAIDIPETPVSTRHVSKLNKVPITTVPESPDVSDRDDSFIAPSQPKGEKCFKNSSSHFIKPSSNVISIQPVGSNKIDNVYWSSSKRSVSLNSQLNDSHDELDKSNKSINGSIHDMETQNPFANNPVIKKCNNIHNAETQAPFGDENSEDRKDDFGNIHNMETQVPYLNDKFQKQNKNDIHEMETQGFISNPANDSTDSIYTANTQLPQSPSIHSLATQLPIPSTEHLPEVRKIENQQEMQINLFAATKENDIEEDIFSADTQPSVIPKETENREIDGLSTSKDSKVVSDSTKFNTSDEEIVLEEFEAENFEDVLDSQPLLPVDYLQENKDDNDTVTPKSANEKSDNAITITKKKDVEIHSDSSTDCEDFLLPSQNNKDENDDDLTDCEDILEEKPKNAPQPICEISSVPNVHFEDMLTQRIDDNIEDLPTQVISFDNKEENNHNLSKGVCFEDLPTQVIDEEITNKVTNISNSIKPSDVESPFKIPFISPIKLKRKDVKSNVTKEKVSSSKVPVEDDNYYSATQDIIEDLCSQQGNLPEGSRHSNESDDELVPSSVEDYKTGSKFPHLENNLSPTKPYKSSDSTDDEDKVGKFVSNLSSQQIRDVIGVDSNVDKLRKEPSDPSDVEITPKKVKPIKFMEIDLPNSQEIKTVVSLHSKTLVTESSSDSETETDSQEQCTPILFKKKRKPKPDAKIDLTKKFDAASLPTRVITRVRKPTSKLQIAEDETKKLTNNILKPKFLTEQEEEIDKDIISENISRLKSKSEKSKLKDNQSGKKTNIAKDEKKKEKENEKVMDKVNKVDENNDKSISSKTANDSKESIKSKNIFSNTPDDEIITVEENIDNRPKRDSQHKTNDKTTTKKTRLLGKELEDSSSKDTSAESHLSTKTTDNEIVIGKENVDKRRKRDYKRKSNDKTTKKTILPAKELEDSSSKDTSTETNVSVKSSRSTRSRRIVDAAKQNSQTEEKPQTSRKERAPRQKQSKNPIEIDLTEEVTEVRRSKRQRTSKEKKEEEVKQVKSILKKTEPLKHEQSTVYSLSSESESPSSLKRSATTELGPPSPKRTRSNAATSEANNVSLRSTPARFNRTQHVLFTAFPSEEVRVKLEKLGAVIVSDVSACTMVLTLQIKRTFKLLCAVGLGRPIVGPNWVQACADSNMIVDPWLYVLKDEVAEKRFQFNLERVLQSKRNFLKGFNVSSTPNVLPNATEMKLIVECSGGVWKEGGPQWICVSCVADKALWPLLKKRGAVVVSTEFILGGVLRQRVDITANKL